MKTLYESILGSTNSGKGVVDEEKTIELARAIINDSTEFPIREFIEENGLLLDKQTTEKVAKLLSKIRPYGTIFGKFSIQSLKKQIERNPSNFYNVNWTNPKYAYYSIELEYLDPTIGRRGTTGTLIQYIIKLFEDKIDVLDIPETKTIIDVLSEHFTKYSTIKGTKSEDLGNYRTYYFKDIKKQFITPRILLKLKKMKTLYESILSSTKAGLQGEKQKVIDWIKNSEYYRRNFLHNAISDESQIEVEMKNGKWKVYFTKTIIKPEIFFIYKTDLVDGKIPFKIHSYYVNGDIINAGYHNIEITEDDLVEEVNDKICFIGTTINSLTKIPKGCKILQFDYGHNIGGGSPTVVKGKIQNISLQTISQGCSNKGSGLSCNLKNIKNITVKNTMYISDEMLGYFSLAKGKKYFEKVPSDMLTDFFKDNNVKPENCKFVPGTLSTKYKSYDIKFDKNKGLWCITNGRN